MNKFQSNVINEVSNNIIEVTDDKFLDDLNTVGCCTKSNDKYQILIHTKLNKRESEVIYLHEIGHIYYGHMNYDIDSLLIKVAKRIVSRLNAIYCSKKFAHKVTNICMDIEINSKLLTLFDINSCKYIECTASKFNVTGGKLWYEYLDEIIDYLKPKVTNSTVTDSDEVDLILPDVSPSTGLDQVIDPSNLSDDFDSDQSQCDKSESNSNSFIDIVDENEVNIRNLVNKITTASKDILIDTLKHFNRKTRGNSNIIYPSIKLKRVKKKPKLGILIDVSCSIKYHRVSQALSELNKLKSKIDSSSIIVTWSDYLVEEYSINNIPDKFKIGSSTRIASGIDYIIEKYNVNKLLIISDLEDHLNEWIDRLNKYNKVEFYTIALNNLTHIDKDEALNYLKLNRHYIITD